jgi:hypothetical protein
MFMHPIEHPVIQRSRQRPVALKLVAGSLFIAAMALVMTLWWIATAVWLPIAAAVRFTGSAVRASYECVIYAGEAVVGR